MRCIGILTMVLVLASYAGAQAPLEPPPIRNVTKDSTNKSWSSRQKGTASKAEQATSTADVETLSVETKGNSDIARAVSATEQVQAADIKKSPAKPSAESPVVLAKPTTETPAATPAEAPVTIESPTSDVVEDGTSEIVMEGSEPVQAPITSMWLSGTPSAAQRWYGRLEYLYWKTSNPAPSGKVYETFSVPTLGPRVSTSVINLNDVHTDYEMGLRFVIGQNLTENFGIELGGLWVYPGTDLKATFSQPPGTSVTGTGTLESVVVLSPTGQDLGQANMSFRNRYWGTELNGRWHLIDNKHWTVDGLVGARYFDYAERLAFGYNLTNPSSNAGNRIERFETNNHMIGGQVGSDIQLALLEYVSLSAISRVAILGNMQDVTVKGPAPGMGRFTNWSNLGAHNTGAGTALLEITPGAVFHLTPDITFQAGYTIIWMNNIIRSHEQVDLNQVGKNPLISFKNDDLFITGFTFALTANW